MMYNDFYESCARKESCIQMRAKYNSLLSGFYFRLQMWNSNYFFLYIECENDFFISKLIMKDTQKLKLTNHDLCKDIIQDLVLKRKTEEDRRTDREIVTENIYATILRELKRQQKTTTD
jgi:hypothetical protein